MVAKKKTAAPAMDATQEPFTTDTATGTRKGWGAKKAEPATGGLAGAPGHDLTEEQRAAVLAEQEANKRPEPMFDDHVGPDGHLAPPQDNAHVAEGAEQFKEPAATSDGAPRPNLRKEPPQVSSDEVARNQLIAFVERVERLAEEKKAIADDMREVFAEAKGNGFDVPTLRKAIQRRSKDAASILEADALLDLYEHAIGSAHIKEQADDANG